jgi:flagellar assembly protein FliH
LQARLDAVVAQACDDLLDLAIEIAGQVVRREMALDRAAILPVVREALAQVIDQHARPVVHLAPADLALVRESLAGDTGHAGCRFIADAAVEVGGCLVETPAGEIDATLQTRWRRVLHQLGDARPLPQAPAPPGAET